MGMIDGLMRLLFGSGRNVIAETAAVFRPNAEAASARDAAHAHAALREFGAEFGQPARGLFDRVMDGVNRLPRPALAIGTIALFVSAMTDPVWFAQRMEGIALVPQPLWWLMGAIVSFYFGARYQTKGQEFQRSIAETMARAPRVAAQIKALDALRPGSRRAPLPLPELPLAPGANPALEAWKHARGG